jgi:hypothetical protein
MENSLTHDWTSKSIVVSWESGTARLPLTSGSGAAKYLTARDLVELVAPRRQEWGPSESVISSRGPLQRPDGNQRLSHAKRRYSLDCGARHHYAVGGLVSGCKGVSGLRTKERIPSNRKSLGRSCLALAPVILGSAFTAPAVACLCSCSVFSSRGTDSTAVEVRPAEYDEIFSGLVISTERIDEPVAAAAVSGE